MSDYQAIYDAVRSRLNNCDVGAIIQEMAARGFDASNAIAHGQAAVWEVAAAHQRPSVLFRPALYPDGNQWCALYGADLASGVAGFGDTPAHAMAAFDVAWMTERTPPSQPETGAETRQQDQRDSDTPAPV